MLNWGWDGRGSSTVAWAMALLATLMDQLAKRSGRVRMVKLTLVRLTVEKRVIGTQVLWPICTGPEPRLTCTHGPTMRVKVMALLWGGLPLSTAQTVMRLVALPCSQAGSQRKTPRRLKHAPAGAPSARLSVTGGVPPKT